MKTQKKKHTGLKIFFGFILLLFLAVAGLGYDFYQEYSGTTKQSQEVLEIEIQQGSGAKQIAKQLKEKGVIRYEYSFLLKVRNSSQGNNMRYGTFQIKKGMTLDDIIATFSTGGEQKKGTKFSVPEGYSIEMIGEKLEKEGICTAEEFYTAAKQADMSYDFLSSVPDDSDIKFKLQGFLFPSTYEFSEGATAQEVVDTMLGQFNKVYTEEMKSKARELGYSDYEIVTMASIVEREAKLEEERGTIAGVIYNRLNINMKLQMCPTVLYVITDGKYNINQVLYKDLEVESPYNTYKYEGLPVGPICNPGKTSLEAVLNPESHKYLFYHTDDETKGNHKFSETYQEHENSRQ